MLKIIWKLLLSYIFETKQDIAKFPVNLNLKWKAINLVFFLNKFIFTVVKGFKTGKLKC